jgi:anti-sigma-K factor RskA
MSMSPSEPPDDDLDVLAGEFVLGLLDDHGLVRVAALGAHGPRFEQAVEGWEQRLMPLAEQLPSIAPPARVWPAIAAKIIIPSAAPSAARESFWNSLKFWRGFSLGAGAFGAAGVALALFFAFAPHRAAMPVATATLATQNAGMFVVTAQPNGAGMMLVVSPLHAHMPVDKSMELWLILPGKNPAPLGLLAGDHAVTIPMPTNPLANITLAVSMEPKGGSPTGLPTGPVLAAATFLTI